MISDCPSSLSDRETACLQRWARDKRVVEAGALLGYSTIKLAEVATHVVSIDKHEGYTTPTLRRYLTNLERAGVRGKVTPLVGDAPPLLASVRDVDFAFIDLTGKGDLTMTSIMRSHAPIVGVHDFGRPGCEVEGVVRLLWSHYRWTILELVDTLVVCRRPGNG
jgi:hypothetical protein